MSTENRYRKKQKKHLYQPKTIDVDSTVDILLKYQPDTVTGKVKITGILRERNSRNPVDIKGAKNTRTSTQDALEIDEGYVINTLIEAWQNHNEDAKPRKSPESLNEWQELAANIRSLKDELIANPKNFEEYKSPGQRGWSKSTIAGDLTYLTDTLIPKLFVVYGNKPSEDDIWEFLERENGRYESNEKTSYNDSEYMREMRLLEAWNGRINKLRRIQCYLAYLNETHKDLKVPYCNFNFLPKYNVALREKIKSIGHERYIKAVILLIRLCEVGIPYAFAAAGEFLMGLRVSESCAPLAGDWEIYADELTGVPCGRYILDYQIDSETLQRTDVLKSPSAHRVVFYTYVMARIISMRREQLLNYGYSEDEIAIMPFASYRSTPHEFLSPTRVSTFIKRVLQLAGCTDDWVMAKMTQITGKPVTEVDPRDLTAHILRRTLATFFANSSMAPADLDQFLGHKQNSENREDYLTEDMLYRMCKEIDRAIYFGDPSSSLNSAYRSYALLSGMKYNLDATPNAEFVAEEDLELDIAIFPLLRGSTVLEIEYPDGKVAKDMQNKLACMSISRDESKALVVMPQPTQIEIEQWIAEANAVDISGLLEIYKDK